MSGWFGRLLGGSPQRAPDPDAFVALTAPHHARLYQTALGLCGDRDQAADLTQEALVKAFLAFDRFREGAPPYPWLVRILRNVHLDEVRSAHARRETIQATAPDPPDPRPGPLASVVAAEEIDAVHAAIARLPEEFALVITLVDLQGLTYEDVAEAVEIPIGTVRSRLYRARERLRILLSDSRSSSAPPRSSKTRRSLG